MLAGRGWGKTRVGAEDLAYFALWHPEARCAVVAPTHGDARDVCVEGVSGLLSVLPQDCVARWSRSSGELDLFNGSQIRLFSADQPDRLRGPQHHRVWCDELGAWERPETFDQMLFGLRLGHNPQVIATTTPRPLPLIRDLVARDGQDVCVTRGKTAENAAHIPAQILAELQERYGGTTLGRQELDAELLADDCQMLWRLEQFEQIRAKETPPLTRVVIGVDPAITAGAHADETGIVAAGLGNDGIAYVLADWSERSHPDAWSRRVATLYRHYNASCIVAETNAGGALVEQVLKQVDASLPIRPVRAKAGKAARALPVAALYEQGRVRHVGRLRQLEEQMALFSDDHLGHSPDRVDALVWALTELCLGHSEQPRVWRF